MRIVLFVCLA